MLQFNHFKGRCKPMDKRTSTNGNKVLGYIAKRIAVRDANTTSPFLGYQPDSSILLRRRFSNTTCPFLGYQPKLPTAVKELKNLK